MEKEGMDDELEARASPATVSLSEVRQSCPLQTGGPEAMGCVEGPELYFGGGRQKMESSEPWQKVHSTLRNHSEIDGGSGKFTPSRSNDPEPVRGGLNRRLAQGS